VPRRVLFDLLLLGAVWGAAFLFTRIAVPEFGPVALVEVRVIVATLVVGAMVAWRGKLGELRGHWKAMTVIALLNSAIPFALFAYATRTVPAGFAAVLNSTVPLFGAIVGVSAFREKMTSTRLMGLGVGFLGVLVLVAPRLEVAGTPLAIGAALLGSWMYAVAAHLTRRILPGVHSIVIAAGSLAMSCVILAVPALFLLPESMPSAAAWGSVLALGIVATGLAYIMYFRLLEQIGATGAVAVTYLIPLFGMVWGMLFLHEPITPPMAMGCALILAGVAVTTGLLGKARA
jgi:drug/metabolite transporter (DMT)-like permease